MGIKTEDFAKYIPPKEMTAGIDWMGILDSFDPTVLEDKYINECARRNPFDTCYRWEEDGIAPEPIEGRLSSSRTFASFDRRDLEVCVERIEREGLSPVAYRNARAALIKAIGSKGAAEYNRREYERLGEAGRKQQAEDYYRWKAEREKQREKEKAEYDEMVESGDYWHNGSYEPASMHEKVIRVRKGVLGSNGKPLTQRDFAKYIGYPINKYTEAEKTDPWTRRSSRKEESEVEYDLLEKLIMICHANPYWLFDDDVEAVYAEYDATGLAAEGDAPFVFVKPDIILRWIEAGKPRTTSWEDGRAEKF